MPPTRESCSPQIKYEAERPQLSRIICLLCTPLSAVCIVRYLCTYCMYLLACIHAYLSFISRVSICSP